MSAVLSAVLLAASASAATASAQPGSAEDLVRRLERRNSQVRDLTARFTQTYRSGALGRTLVETGTIALKRPGRMRWEYESPERKTFVADGTRFFFYVPADRQVIVREQAGERGVAMALLSGQGGLLEQFDPELEAREDAALERVRLVPRHPDPEVRSVSVELDAQLRVRSIAIEDAQGNTSRFRFESLRENLELPERLFRFELPRGVEVIQG
jgi:outer membrane lipoprotein carrier protein